MKTILAVLVLACSSARASEGGFSESPRLLSAPQLVALLAHAISYQEWCNGENAGCVRMTVQAEAETLRLFLSFPLNLRDYRRDPVLGGYFTGLERLDRCVQPTQNPFQPYQVRKRVCNSAVQTMVSSLQDALRDSGDGVASPN